MRVFNSPKLLVLALPLAVAFGGCNPEAENVDEEATQTEDALTACTSAVPQRTSNRVSDLPFQKLNRGALPAAMSALAWSYPTTARSMPNNFGAGRSYNEGHEGADLGGGRGNPIFAAAKGTVAYTLSTCPDNSTRRDITCGNGWGNHVVIDHGNGIFTRYAHLSRLTVAVGNTVLSGGRIGDLGHSGLSDGPHLHFELGTKATPFKPCAAPQNFDLVHNPAKLAYGAAPSFTPQGCTVNQDGANARKSPNGDILIVLNKGASVVANGKSGSWYDVSFRLQSKDWTASMHDSQLDCRP
jgi:murein DD-endopeptidase MepM/ murein hydrolase activator NlpD